MKDKLLNDLDNQIQKVKDVQYAKQKANGGDIVFSVRTFKGNSEIRYLSEFTHGIKSELQERLCAWVDEKLNIEIEKLKKLGIDLSN